jgi:hypothetical protein
LGVPNANVVGAFKATRVGGGGGRPMAGGGGGSGGTAVRAGGLCVWEFDAA